MKIEIFAFALLLVVVESIESAYDRVATCDNSNKLDAVMQNQVDRLVTKFANDDSFKTEGSLGIVGGMSGSPIPLYYAAMAAHRIGISDVRIFTSFEVHIALQKMSPDLKVYDVDTTVKLIQRLQNLDVILLGPGMGPIPTILNNIVNTVVKHCRDKSIPLIVDLDEWFYLPAFFNSIGVFPASGITLLTNRKEFEKVYEAMKKPGGDDSRINLDEARFGANVYILRKTCTDRGIAVDKSLSWLISVNGAPKRSVGQGHLVAGAVGAYYVFALKNMPEVSGMRVTAIATYAGATHVRSCTQRAHLESKNGMVTSDILEKMKDHFSSV